MAAGGIQQEFLSDELVGLSDGALWTLRPQPAMKRLLNLIQFSGQSRCHRALYERVREMKKNRTEQ